ncbi:anaerobic sulfatase maturase [Nissabacter sp. SGAir0207]|uniref:anaerobic sulfatase maturase n=1 Tax=Nissabacter sp. SGAir0207 TaxID=2126321 RepID=UPI0010CD5D54|nr:anaerobic sulfatase maturase [Nissabacter sp. SGAir0207]QCR35920.1 anaerobic sulfatase maturase [Nissabacter sp. SGAir0207]
MANSILLPGAQPAAPLKSQFYTMVKPVGASCNLDCRYCYYLHKESLLQQQRSQPMPPALLAEWVKQYIASQSGREIVFSWQGGEPTLAGLAYFEQIITLQQRFQPAGQRIVNTLQTNGTLLNERWCRWLKAHDFLVGLSIDGPEKLHDAFRLTRQQQPTFGMVMRGVEMLKKHNVAFNTLTVVNRLNAHHPLEVYRFLRDEVRPLMIQLIPCVEPKDFCRTAPQSWRADQMPRVGSAATFPGDPAAVVTDWSVKASQWGDFLCRVFDEWYGKDLGFVFVNLFETAVAQMMGLPAQICTHSRECGKALALEQDGSVYACDHYVYPEYRLGNIQQTPIATLASSARQSQFGRDKSAALTAYCRQCVHLSLCWGECPRNRFIQTPDGEPGLNYLCPGLKKFYQHAHPALRRMAADLA